MKTKLLSLVTWLLALGSFASAQTTTLTINNATGHINVPVGLSPYFDALSITNALPTPQQYGAVADGSSHPVSGWIPSRYANLAAVQVDFPDVFTTADEIDWACIQRALRNSKSVFLPAVPNGAGYRINRPIVFQDATQKLFGATRWTDHAGTGGARILAGPGIDAIRVPVRDSVIHNIGVTGTTVSIHSISAASPTVLTTNSAHGLATAPAITNGWTISANTVASPTIVTTSAAHGLCDGEFIKVSGSSAGVIDGIYRVIVTDSSGTRVVNPSTTATHFKLINNDQTEKTAGSNGGACSFVRVYEIGIGPKYGSGQPAFADVTGITSGPLVVGQIYKMASYGSGDNFTNIGAASNATNVRFRATGTTPATWTNGTSLSLVTEVLGFYHAIPSSTTAMALYATTDNSAVNITTAATNDTGVLYATRRAFSFGSDGGIDNALNSPDEGSGYSLHESYAGLVGVAFYLGCSDAGSAGNNQSSDVGIGTWADGNLDTPAWMGGWNVGTFYAGYMVTRTGGLAIHGGGAAGCTRPFICSNDLSGQGSGGCRLEIKDVYAEDHVRDTFADGSYSFYVDGGANDNVSIDGLSISDNTETPCHFHIKDGGWLNIRGCKSYSTQLKCWSTGGAQQVYGDPASNVKVNLNGSAALTFDALQFTAGDYDVFSSGNVFGTDIAAASAAQIGRRVMILWEGSGTPGGLYQCLNVNGTARWLRGGLVGPDKAVYLTPGAASGSPVEGMIYGDVSDHHLYYYNGSAWKQLDN